MVLKIKKPQIATPGNVADFVKQGDKKVSGTRLTARAFKFEQTFIDIIDSEAEAMKHNKIEILKAGLAAFAAMSQEEKDYWLLQQRRM